MSGGYDYDFIDSPSEDLQCSICLSVLRDPHLTSCCGNHFCHVCISRIQKDNSPCPLCQEKEFTTFLNKSISRKINELQIRCPHSEQGCQWIGFLKEISEHLNTEDGGCDYTEVECSQCHMNLFRYAVAEHETTSCSERLYSCEHCGKKASWRVITEEHLPQCEDFPLPCPNECDVGKIKRKCLEKHVNEDCPLQVVSCSFNFVGCPVKKARKEILQHSTDAMAAHLTFMADKFKQLLAENEKRVNEADGLKQLLSDKDKRIANLEATVAKQAQSLRLLEMRPHHSHQVMDYEPKYIPPVNFYMTDFEEHREDEDQWFSEPFYSHPGGYKLCLSVFAYGIGTGRSSHVSVFANLMRGENDDDLPWPFCGDIEVELITDDEDYEKTLSFTSKSPAKAAKRVEWPSERNEFGQGTSKFVAYSDICSEETLHFRVTSVCCKCF